MAQIIGVARIGRDADLKNVNGTSVINLSLAFSYRDQSGKKTQWVRGSLWGTQAEKLAQYLLKGTQISVILDDINAQLYTKQDGTSEAIIQGRIIKIEFVGNANSGDEKPQQTQQTRQSAPPPQTTKQAPNNSQGSGGYPSFDDDDIPF